jgi:hypothetical protein
MRLRDWLGLALWVMSYSGQAGEYGSYQLERLVIVDPIHSGCQIDLAYLDPWLADLATHTLQSASGFSSAIERQHAKDDLQALEAIVGLAVLEQGTTVLLKRSAMLATMAYQLEVRGAAARAERAFSRWLLQSPDDVEGLYRYGQFLLGSGHAQRAVFYLEKSFQHGVLDAEYPLAIALQRSGAPQEAEAHLHHYQLTHPDNPPVNLRFEPSVSSATEVKK